MPTALNYNQLLYGLTFTLNTSYVILEMTFPTKHLAGTSKLATKLQHRNLNNSYKKNYQVLTYANKTEPNNLV